MGPTEAQSPFSRLLEAHQAIVPFGPTINPRSTRKIAKCTRQLGETGADCSAFSAHMCIWQGRTARTSCDITACLGQAFLTPWGCLDKSSCVDAHDTSYKATCLCACTTRNAHIHSCSMACLCALMQPMLHAHTTWHVHMSSHDTVCHCFFTTWKRVP